MRSASRGCPQPSPLRQLPSFPKIPPGSCDLSGQPGTFDSGFPVALSFCPDCQRRRFAFQIARSYGSYEGTLARAILLLKHEHIGRLAAGSPILSPNLFTKNPSGWPPTFSSPWPFTGRERTGLPPGGSFWPAPCQGSRPPLSPGSADAVPAATRRTFASQRRALGGRTWRFCHSRGRSG